MNRTKKVECLFEGPFIKLYDATFEDKKGKERHWRFASRRKLGNTLPETGVEKSDAVVIVPLWGGKTIDDDVDPMFVVTKEYRAPLGGYEYGVPAGLIDVGESVEEAARRELKEETGLEMGEVHHVTPPLYSSAGLSDESTAMVFVDCYGDISTEGNEDLEDIEVILVSLEDMKKFVEDGIPFYEGEGRLGAKAYISWLFCVSLID